MNVEEVMGLKTNDYGKDVDNNIGKKYFRVHFIFQSTSSFNVKKLDSLNKFSLTAMIHKICRVE